MNDATDYFNVIYDATFRDLMRYCLLKVPLFAADDVLQNTYAQFYRMLCRRRQTIDDPKAYLITILKHEIASYYRSRAKRRELPLETLGDETNSVSVEDLGLDHIAIDELRNAIKDEPESTQRMFLLYYGYEMKLHEIASEMGTTTASVKNRLARLRRKLKTMYEKEKEL